ncbi:hypothetical protein [Clostridium beijerinckii]|uniref:Uncharacterized protein n=1 Tax=Clostridium beijerinckii TaxID=1520 RepID=A0AAE5H044_CLOBE|nr:hypothetical protein [Clostridium beijerinckii]NSB12088.1 hypothetical protein [Clostridium beijerinckii]OOM27422.1 hypothetical protein CLOBE_29800 [Clostridium beijerinckii]
MKVDKNRDSLTNKFISASITNIKANDYVELMLLLRLRQECLEKDIEECSKENHLKRFVANKQKELLQVNKLIKIME